MQRPSSTSGHAQGSKRARASFEQRAEQAMHSSAGAGGAGEAGVPNSALLGLASMCSGAGDGRRSSLCADRVPPTPRASWKAACPFLAQLASFAEQEKEGSEVVSSGHEHAVATPPATKLQNKATMPATPFATANVPPSSLVATQNSCSNRRKSVARRTLAERAGSADIQQQAQQQQEQAEQQQQQQQQQEQQQQWQGGIASTPSSADVLRSNKQLAQQQHAVAAQHWAAACTSLALDSFLEPRLAIRAPRPRVHTGLSPEDCFPPSMTVCLHSSCDRQARNGMDTPSSLLASQLQACLSSLDAGLQQTADLQGRSPCFLSPRTPAACATPSQRCMVRLPSEDLESCYNSSNQQQLCK